jgi:hypothetical protein
LTAVGLLHFSSRKRSSELNVRQRDLLEANNIQEVT